QRGLPARAVSCGSSFYLEAPQRRLEEGGKRALHDRSPRATHEVEQEGHVVQGQQAQAEDLALRHQVAHVGAREAAAAGAAAARIERCRVAREACVLEVEPALPGD